MRIKTGVRTYGFRPEMTFALLAAYDVVGSQLVITSVSEGKHKRASKHYTGYAMDIRTHNLLDPKAAADEIRQSLGTDFDVILEVDHIHIEFDPKESY